MRSATIMTDMIGPEALFRWRAPGASHLCGVSQASVDMNVSDSGDEQPLAWSAALLATPVYSSDGDRVGLLDEILGSQAEDIFHGIVVSSADRGRRVEIAAVNVTSITNQRVEISLTSEEVRALPEYGDERTYRLNVSGGRPHDVSWTEDRDKGPR